MNLYKKIAAVTLLCTLSATLHAADYWKNRREELQVIKKAQVDEARYGAALKTALETKFAEKRWLDAQSQAKQRKFADYIKHYKRLAEAVEIEDPSIESEPHPVSSFQFELHIQDRSAALHTTSNITSAFIRPQTHQHRRFKPLKQQKFIQINTKIAEILSNKLRIEAPHY